MRQIQNEQKELWRREYTVGFKQKGLKSLFHHTPSRAVSRIISFLAHHNIKSGVLLDLGCANGRNSIPFAKLGLEVFGIDFIEEALEDFQVAASREGVSHRVHIYLGDIGEPWPFGNDLFDVAIDITSFSNLKLNQRLMYKDELCRTLKSNSLVFIYTFSNRDGYYGPMARLSPGGEPGSVLSVDDGIWRKLYSPKELEQFFSDSFITLEHLKFEWVGRMFGKRYFRSLFMSVFSRRGN